jgi:hypothetical protein
MKKIKLISMLGAVGIIGGGLIGAAIPLTACGKVDPVIPEIEITVDNPCGLNIDTTGAVIGFLSGDQTTFNNAVANFTKIKFGEGITAIGGNVFQNNVAFNDSSKQKIIEFNANVTTIGASAFRNRIGISEVSFNKVKATDGTLSFGDYAFDSCTNLTKITFLGNDNIPSLTIGQYAFQNCVKLADFAGAVANSIVVTSIGASAFIGCTSLNYDMLDKINSAAALTFTKVQDTTGSKKFIYFKPIGALQEMIYTVGCLAYGEIP